MSDEVVHKTFMLNILRDEMENFRQNFSTSE